MKKKKKLKPITTYVLGSGDVSLGTAVFLSKWGLLTFQNCKSRMPMGSDVKEKDLTGRQCAVIFNQLSDIDNLVERLLELREKVDAANNRTTGHSDKPRKVSRKGKKR